MAVVAERVTVDPVTEDATLQPLDLVGLDRSWGIYLLEHDYPPPEVETQHGGNADSEGDVVVESRYGNRIITARVRVFEPEDPAAVNLVPNPSAELATTGYVFSAVSMAEGTLTRELNPSFYQGNAGDYALRVKGKKDATVTQRNVAVVQSTAIGSVVPGQKYSFSAPVNILESFDVGLQVRIDWYTAGSVFISTSAASALYTGTGELRMAVAGQVAPATASFATLVLIGFTKVSSKTVDFRTDGWQFEGGEAVTPYFDGDTPGCDWSAARHASTSSRPAPDGTRFSRICRDVTRKLDRIKRQKSGTLRRYSALGGGNPLTYDLLSARVTDAPQTLDIGRKRAEYGLAYEAKPGGRGPEVLVATAEELTKPALTFLAENVPGELPGLGRFVLTEKQGFDQKAVWLGLQQRYYDAAATAGLFFEAESLTPLSGAATAALAGASGAGNNTVLQGNLVNAWQGVFSTQASGGGAHLSNVGSFRVLARMYRPTANTGEVSAKFTWTEGDFVNVTENDANEVRFGKDDREGVFTIEDLGVVTLEKAPAGTTQRWEGRMISKSTVSGDDLYVDWLLLIPTEEGSGSVEASNSIAKPTTLGAFDQMITGAGAMVGRVAGIGGVWAGAGDTDDFTQAVGGATRTALSDVAGTPRYEILGATVYSDVLMKLRVATNNATYDGGKSYFGGVVRYIDVNNWLAILIEREASENWPGVNANQYYAALYKKVAGVKTFVTGSYIQLGQPINTPGGGSFAADLEVAALANGEWRIAAWGSLKTGNDPVLNSTGALKEGKVGLFDEKLSAVAETRQYANLEAWAPTVDAAAYANRNFELRNNRARREDRGGTTWGRAAYEGDYLLIPPAGPEKSITRVVAKMSRNPDSDGGIDDLKGQLYVAPRYLMAPPS